MFLGRVKPSVKEIYRYALPSIASEEIKEEEWKGREGEKTYLLQ